LGYLAGIAVQWFSRTFEYGVSLASMSLWWQRQSDLQSDDARRFSFRTEPWWVAQLALAEGDHTAAGTCLERAQQLFTNMGAPFSELFNT